MVSLDCLRATLGALDGETVYEAAERVVRERDRWRCAAMDMNMQQVVLGKDDPLTFDFSQWRPYTEDP